MSTPVAGGSSSQVVGLVADTHGLLDEGAVEVLRGANGCILHAGDVGDWKRKSRLSADSLLSRLAAETGRHVEAVEGNVDEGRPPGTADLPKSRLLRLQGKSLLLLHICGVPPDSTACSQIAELKPDIVVFGHTHVPLVKLHDGVLFINPGSAGPQRFKLPRSVALLHLAECGGSYVEFHSLKASSQGVPGPFQHPCTANPVHCSFCSLPQMTEI